jgi:predicted NBD/HSP70 family sugar kinase
VDIGGTKIKAGAVEAVADGGHPCVVVFRQLETPRLPPPAFYDAVAAAVRELRREAQEAGFFVLPVVALAHPGRFLPDGRLARGTTPNLGTAPSQYDGLSPAAELRQRLGGTVVAENDAVAQMRFGIRVLLEDPLARPRLLGETAVYLGPGTGMGGGVARISREGAVTPVTDGHLFDMQVPGCGDGTLTAEELFTGPAIARVIERENQRLASPIRPARAGQLDIILMSPEVPAEHRAVAERVADAHGEILAALIEAVADGRIAKVRLEAMPDGQLLRHVDEPDRAWSAADKALVTGARRFVLGGFVGCSRLFGARVRGRALEMLRRRGRADVEIFQIPADSADAGLLGIVTAVSEKCQTLFKAGKVSDTITSG